MNEKKTKTHQIKSFCYFFSKAERKIRNADEKFSHPNKNDCLFMGKMVEWQVWIT